MKYMTSLFITQRIKGKGNRNIKIKKFFLLCTLKKMPSILQLILILIDPRSSTNQGTSLKSGSLFLLVVSVRPSVNT